MKAFCGTDGEEDGCWSIAHPVLEEGEDRGVSSRVEARDQEDLWCPCPYAFAFPSPNSETFCYFLSLPHLQCSPCPTIGQYSGFFTFIIKKFKHRKNGKNCTLNMSLPFRFYNEHFLYLLYHLSINHLIFFLIPFKVSNINMFHL